MTLFPFPDAINFLKVRCPARTRSGEEREECARRLHGFDACRRRIDLVDQVLASHDRLRRCSDHNQLTIDLDRRDLAIRFTSDCVVTHISLSEMAAAFNEHHESCDE
jgi:hypothetical protein